MWLGERRGYAVDWATQLWVRATGRRVRLDLYPWLRAPIGATRSVGAGWMGPNPAGARGLLADLDALAAPGFDPTAVAPAVRRFYEETSGYRMDLWPSWSFFAGIGARVIRRAHAAHLDQLSLPIDVMDAASGVTSDVFEVDGASAWLRRYQDSGRVIYAGVYSVAKPDGQPPLVRVAFPLPNGDCIVLLRPENGPAGALRLVSRGRRFGEPGMYLTVARGDGIVSVRRTPIAELFTVFAGEDGSVRTDHLLWMYGYRMARLHYRIESTA